MKSLRITAAAVMAGLMFFTAGCPLPHPPCCAPPPLEPVAPYGCKTNANFTRTQDAYEGTIDPRYYLNYTGIIVKNGDKIDVKATGRVCFSSGQSYCGGPEGSVLAWPLYWTFTDSQGNAMQTEMIGGGIEKILAFGDSSEYEMVFLVPELNSVGLCNEEARKDNSGSYQATVKVSQ